jgi:hypothetical protein
MQIQCDHGAQYPAMVNASSGSYSLTFRCYILDGRYLMTTPLTESFVELFGSGVGEVGFAMPLQSGRFAVSRYSLVGSLATTAQAARVAQERGSEGQQGLRDFTI